MPAATPAKRVLADSTNNGNNVQATPRSVKRPRREDYAPIERAHAGAHAVVGPNASFRSSQPKSQQKSRFEEDVLEKMSQDMADLKHNNNEKDQQWARPPLDDFDPRQDSLCFQQIEIEEGMLNGGKTAIKLFGVTETGHSVLLHVTDFIHYFYLAAPVGFGKNDCEPFKLFLENEAQKSFNSYSAIIHSVQMTMKENMYGFQGNQKSPYLRISVTDPRNIARVRRLDRKSVV